MVHSAAHTGGGSGSAAMVRDTEPVDGEPEWDEEERDTSLECPWRVGRDKRGNWALWMHAAVEGGREPEPDAWLANGRLHIAGFGAGIRTLPADAVAALLRTAEVA